MHNLEHGYSLLWYDATIADDSDQLAVVQAIAAKYEGTKLTDKFIALPWTSEDGKAFPKGTHVALTHWSAGGDPTDVSKQQGVWQYCAKPERQGRRRSSPRTTPTATRPSPRRCSPDVPGHLADLLGVLGVAFASALVPLINIEAYLGVRGSVGGIDNVWVLGLAAAVGQMVGKLVWYYLGASSLSWALGAQAHGDAQGPGPPGEVAHPHARAAVLRRRAGVPVRVQRVPAVRDPRRCSPASCG